MALGLLLLVLVLVGLAFVFYVFSLGRAKHGEATAQPDEDVAEQREDEEKEKAAALIDSRLQKKLKLKKTREEYHLKLKDRIETQFQVFQPFSPKEQMLIRLDVARSVQQTRWEILEDSSSPAFRLEVVNALESSRIPPVPRLIQEADVYPVLLGITP